MGQVESICDALGHEEHFKYNLRGELIEKVDKEGFLTTYAYTPHGDVEKIQYADGKEVKMKYNQLRQLTEIQDWLGTTKISLDYLGRPIEVVDHNNKAVTYEWGKLGEKRSISYPGGQVVNYEVKYRLNIG